MLLNLYFEKLITSINNILVIIKLWESATLNQQKLKKISINLNHPSKMRILIDIPRELYYNQIEKHQIPLIQ